MDVYIKLGNLPTKLLPSSVRKSKGRGKDRDMSPGGLGDLDVYEVPCLRKGYTKEN